MSRTGTAKLLAVALGCSAANLGGAASAATYHVLYSFQGGSDGAVPYGGLIDVGGTLYGTTSEGGAACPAPGCGIVFSITPGGSEAVVYAFKGQTAGDGLGPRGTLLSVGGTLYGTTPAGGTFGGGTLFSVAPGGTETVLHSFGHGSDGSQPFYGALVKVGARLYGTTNLGGANNLGTVFSSTLGGKEKVLYSFKGQDDGANPYSGLILVGGVLYGTTESSGFYPYGSVFAITPGGTETDQDTLTSLAQGANPYSTLLFHQGMFYGTGIDGGANGGGHGVQLPARRSRDAALFLQGRQRRRQPARGRDQHRRLALRHDLERRQLRHRHGVRGHAEREGDGAAQLRGRPRRQQSLGRPRAQCRRHALRNDPRRRRQRQRHGVHGQAVAARAPTRERA